MGFHLDIDVVVLKCDQWKCKTVVAAEPELHWDVHGVCWDSSAVNSSKCWNITDHLVVSAVVCGSLCEFVPDVHPVTVVFINDRSADLDLDTFDECKTHSAAEAPV